MKKKADLFRDRPAEEERDPFWALVVFFGLTILVCHCFDLIRSTGRVADWFGEHWEYVYFVARDSGDLAFAGLFVVVIWFGTNGSWVFGTVLLLGLANWLENELVSRAFFGGFIRTSDWWEWETINASMAVIVAIVAMPAVKWMTRSKQVFTRSISIADILLLTLASALLITAAGHYASLRDGWFDEFAGSDQVARHLVSSGLMCVIGLTVIYVSYFGRLTLGASVYLLAWGVYIGSVELLRISGLKPSIDTKSWTFESLWHGVYDRYIPVFAWFLLAILMSRLVSRYWARSKLAAIDLGSTGRVG